MRNTFSSLRTLKVAPHTRRIRLAERSVGSLRSPTAIVVSALRASRYYRQSERSEWVAILASFPSKHPAVQSLVNQLQIVA